ncbi:MAG: aminoacetone oxidase family FAD-binding enzyme, partial [Lachnospiraceae bacterium]|nr:aminoacetone oxidase family FAD-binding enzyme [Lachnospiraceae bacterium]
MIYDVCVVGCGAAGMMAAYAAASSGKKTVIIEKNEKAGKKIYITGKGRCNVTNACDVTDFFSHVITNEKFLYSSIYGFTAMDVMSLIESYGCNLKVERGERVFPVSDHSSDIIKAMVNAVKDKDVEIRFNTDVTDILSETDGEGNTVATGVKLSDKSKLTAKKVIIATGGLSYPSTGSTGDGYKFAEKFGHKIVPTAPSLVALVTREKWPSDLMGLSLKNVSVNLSDKATGKNIYNGFGEMLFTHFGV